MVKWKSATPPGVSYTGPVSALDGVMMKWESATHPGVSYTGPLAEDVFRYTTAHRRYVPTNSNTTAVPAPMMAVDTGELSILAGLLSCYCMGHHQQWNSRPLLLEEEGTV